MAMVFKALRSGRQTALRYKRMIFILWLINVACALMLTLPLYNALVETTGHSLDGRRLVDHYDWNWFTDFITVQSPFFRGLSGVYLALVFLYILANTFFAGGLLAMIAGHKRFTLSAFFSEAGHYFPRLIRLMILSLGFYYFLDFLFNRTAAGWITNLTRNSPAENTAFYWDLARQGLYVLSFFFINLVFDYAKIEAVAQETRSALFSLIRGLGFVFRHPGQTLGAYYAMAAVQGILLVVVSVLDGFLNRSTLFTLVLAVGLSQILLLARAGLRVMYLAGALVLYQELNRQTFSAPVEPLMARASAMGEAVVDPQGLVQISPPPPRSEDL